MVWPVISSLKRFINLRIKQSNNKTSEDTFHQFPNSPLSVNPEDKYCELIEVVFYTSLLE